MNARWGMSSGRWRPWRALVGLLLLVLVVRLAWGWWAARKLQAQLDAIRARGEPVSVEDVVHVEVPDVENAWRVQLAAATAITVDSPSNSALEFKPYLPFPPEWYALAAASESAHGQVFALARQARQCSDVQLYGPLRSPLLANTPAWLGMLPAKGLSATLTDGAIYAHLQGDDAEAVERALDALHLSRSVRHGQWLVDQLVATGMDSGTYRALQLIGPGLRLDSRSATRPATPGQVRLIIAQLLDEEPLRENLQASVAMERLFWLDTLHHQAKGSWFISPLADLQACRLLPRYDCYSLVSRCPSWPEAQSLFDGIESEVMISRPRILFGAGATVPRYSRWFHGYAMIWDRVMKGFFRNLAERRTTAMALACQLYRADQGRWPDRLDQLVPAYLPAVPSDPYHEDGRPIGYVILKGKLPDGGDRPLLYYDFGAADVPVPLEPSYSANTDPRPDGVKHLCRQYRDLARFAPAASEQAVENQPEKPDAPGDEPQQDDRAR